MDACGAQRAATDCYKLRILKMRDADCRGPLSPPDRFDKILRRRLLGGLRPMKKLIQLFVFAALVTAFALPALAQTTPATGTTTTAAAGGQGDAEAKAALYDTFTKNIKTNPTVAYDAGKEYLQKYEATDGPTDQYVAYIKKWVTSYEKVARRQQLLKQLSDKNYNEAFASSQQVLADFPDDLEVLYRLVGAGFIALDSKNTANNAAASTYAKKLIQLVEAGKSPDTSKSKDEILGNLNYALGLFTQTSQPTDAINYFIKAAQYEGSSKKDPKTYLFLADLYEKGEYTKLATQYNTSCKTPEQLQTQECKDLGVKVNQVVDHMIDALARAIAYSNVGPDAAKLAQARAAWMEQLTTYYKFRNEGSDTGLKELIASITSRPLPKPGEPIVPPLMPQSPSATPSSSTTPTTPSGTASVTPAATRTTTTPAATNMKQGTTSTTTSSKTATPAGKTSTTKTTPRRSH
jgi:tetratricopeptide (TPR) repeat protein